MLVAVLLWGCDESLPPRSEPAEFLAAGLGVPTEPVIIRHGYPGIPSWGEIHGATGSFQVWATNLHDEVLQETALIRAQLRLRWIADPAQQRLLTFGVGDLNNTRMLRGQTLTIGVDSAATLVKNWDQRTDSGTPFWDLVRLRVLKTSKGVIYYESDSVQLIADGWIQVFENVQPRKIGPVQITLVYQLVDTLIGPSKSQPSRPNPLRASGGAPAAGDSSRRLRDSSDLPVVCRISGVGLRGRGSSI